MTCSFVLRCSLPSIGDIYVSSVIPFRQQPVKFFIFSTSYYCLKLHGLLENSTSKRIALKVMKRKNTACTVSFFKASVYIL